MAWASEKPVDRLLAIRQLALELPRAAAGSDLQERHWCNQTHHQPTEDA
jgi:hypothetical protein